MNSGFINKNKRVNSGGAFGGITQPIYSYWGKPRLITGPSGKHGEVVIKKVADPKLLKAYQKLKKQ